MTFAAQDPIAASGLVIRYFDTIALRDSGLPASRGMAGTIAWVEETQSYYALRPSASTGALSWSLLSSAGGIVESNVRVIGDVDAIVAADDATLSFQTALTAPRTVTLPAASPATAGRTIVIKSVNAVNGANTCAIAGVDGGVSTISTAYGSRTVQDNGVSWSLIASV